MTTKSEQAKIISSNIIELRKIIGWNQAKLASKADITAAALSMIEKGEKRIPTIVVLRKLANALKVEIQDITGEQPMNLSVAKERDRVFFRKFGVLDELDKEDQKTLLDMAERLKEITQVSE